MQRQSSAELNRDKPLSTKQILEGDTGGLGERWHCVGCLVSHSAPMQLCRMHKSILRSFVLCWLWLEAALGNRLQFLWTLRDRTNFSVGWQSQEISGGGVHMGTVSSGSASLCTRSGGLRLSMSRFKAMVGVHAVTADKVVLWNNDQTTTLGSVSLKTARVLVMNCLFLGRQALSGRSCREDRGCSMKVTAQIDFGSSYISISSSTFCTQR